MNSRPILLLGCCWGLAITLHADVTVINAGLQTGMNMPSGVTLNNVMTATTGQTPNNLALLTTTGTASGLSLTASAAGYAMGGGGSFSPIGTPVYDNSSSIINGWIADYQTPYGTIWQGGTNSSSTGQTMNLTLTGLTASTHYSITLLSARGNTFTNIQNPGTIGFTYGGSTAGVTTAFQGTGTLADTTLSMTTSAGDASGLNAREITWTLTTGTTPQNAVVALTGAWNLNALIISATQAEPIGITSFSADDHYVTSGSTVTLAWDVVGADTLAIDPFPGAVSGESVEVTVNETTTFTLTATTGESIDTATVRVAVGPERPNIVLFMVDDMGWQDTSVPFHHDASGNPVVTGFNQRYRTPHMAALAASGMKFTNAYSSAVCSPSRTSLMTGMSACRHRVTQWTLYPNTDQSGVSANLKSPLDWNVNGLAPASDTSTPRTWRTNATLPKLLQQAGYRTIHVGKAHFGADGLPGEEPGNLGFDVNIAGHAAGGPGSYLGTLNFGSGIWQVPGLEAYHGTNTFLSEALTIEGNKAMEQAVADGHPFYLYMSHYAIHVPFAEDVRFAANYPGLDATERKYATMIEGMDKSLGDIRAKLNQLGVAENTLILFYSDNGGITNPGSRGITPSGTGDYTHNKPLRAGKGSAYEGGTRVPAIASWAAVNSTNAFQQQLPIAPASRCDKPVIIEDIHPTLLEVARLPAPEAIDGISFTGYLKNDPAFTRPVSLLFHYPHVWIQSLIVANEGYEMHSSLREGDWKVIHYYEGSRWEIYNLANDLGEANNLAASRPDLVLQLGRRMIRLLEDRGACYPANRTTNLPQRPLLPNNATVDSDNDGRSDIQEDPNRNGLQDPGETDPDNRNSDGDNVNDGDEARLGLDPLNPSSRFAAIPSLPAAGVLRLTWPSAPGTTFTLRASPDLADWSEVVAAGIPASPGTTTSRDLDTISGPRRFFRVGLDP